jgi:hypothetical protein
MIVDSDEDGDGFLAAFKYAYENQSEFSTEAPVGFLTEKKRAIKFSKFDKYDNLNVVVFEPAYNADA